MSVLDELKYDDQGLIPAIVQDCEHGEVLMMAWMNRESLQRTIDTGRAHPCSRSRQQFWLKGERRATTCGLTNSPYNYQAGNSAGLSGSSVAGPEFLPGTADFG